MWLLVQSLCSLHTTIHISIHVVSVATAFLILCFAKGREAQVVIETFDERHEVNFSVSSWKYEVSFSVSS